MVRSFRSKALGRYWHHNDASKLRPDWVRKIRTFLNRLHAATRPEDLATAGSGFHALKGDLAGRYALTVSPNWRITFGWDGEDAIEIDLEDYHG